LEYLDLGNTQVGDVAPLVKLITLQTLYLDETQVSDVALLAGLTGLRHLAITGAPVRNVRALDHLSELEITGNESVATRRPGKRPSDTRRKK
jgi:Leucine-rich repeat (LRR) protein